MRAQLIDPLRSSRVSLVTRTGPEGPILDGTARELLKATYLRPLCEAEAELRSGRGSCLSQILAGYPAIQAQEKSLTYWMTSSRRRILAGAAQELAARGTVRLPADGGGAGTTAPIPRCRGG
ncbi:hypothetical protein ABZS68_38630 [Streptomyces sp. NPDC005571]|uniref:hypothetical protein n=1 Tax=Streptomyces sp. NPDC005571 TaxID=3156888 RepID=UPI0033BA14AB